MNIAELLNTQRLFDAVHTVPRQIFHGERKETVSEHSLSCINLLFYFLPNIDSDAFVHIIQLLRVHDVHEDVCGDTVIFDVTEETKQVELLAAKTLLAPFPQLYAYWQEFAENVTPNARIANKLDKIQAVVKIISNDGLEWKTGHTSYKQAKASILWVLLEEDVLSQYMNELLDYARKKQMFYEGSNK